MDWQHKAAALNALTELTICIRAPGDWFIQQRGCEIGSEKSALLIGSYGNGNTPDEAVEDHWTKMVTALKPDQYIVLFVGHPPVRKHVLWNGFMWQDQPISETE